MTSPAPDIRAERIRIHGQVQGVGFRPHVWRVARDLGVAGRVRNDAEGVLIDAAGADLDRFVAALRAQAPPLSRIDRIVRTDLAEAAALPDPFEIAASGASGAETRVTPDAATCADCLAEIRDPTARRYRYAFTNCTHCGPRFTILSGLPYDRAQTTMAPFEMCSACRAEYRDPADRRFHAQPIACPACGPRLSFEGSSDGDPIEAAAALLRVGGILAVKGLGGVHLACDATNAAAIAALRARKRRPTKPLAIMAPLETVRRHAALTPEDAALLGGPDAPILLLAKAGASLPDGLAPGQTRLGWMLPYTPLHHLLCDATGLPLVMTSANLSGQPQIIGNAEARAKLDGIADGWLLHDREIARRLDDSVVRRMDHGPVVLRRARGQVPGTLPMPPGFDGAPQTIGLGGHLKSAICLLKNDQLLLSHHLGDLDDALTVAEFEKADADYSALFDHRPALFACDLHPGYHSSQHAERRAGAAPLIRVQHHHAHLAACLAENGWPREGGPVAGILLDGLGLGDDGTIWGGELLLGDYAGVARIAHLSPAPLPGGDMAQTEPWRNLLARLDQAGLSEAADRLMPDRPRDLLRKAVARGVNAPLSSSAGRLFDAVAAAVGAAPARQSFEGEAAMRLEALAEHGDGAAYPMAGLDPAPLFRAVVADLSAGRSAADIAFCAHAGMAQAFAAQARALVETGRAEAVALSGGCFQNGLLTRLCVAALGDLPVMLHRTVPANDGGLALGQAAVAAAQHIVALESD